MTITVALSQRNADVFFRCHSKYRRAGRINIDDFVCNMSTFLPTYISNYLTYKRLPVTMNITFLLFAAFAALSTTSPTPSKLERSQLTARDRMLFKDGVDANPYSTLCPCHVRGVRYPFLKLLFTHSVLMSLVLRKTARRNCSFGLVREAHPSVTVMERVGRLSEIMLALGRIR